MPLQRADDAYDTSKFDGVQFPMTDLTAGGNRIIYVVSDEALRDRAAADGDAASDTVETFLKHRPQIEKIASDKHDAGNAERVVNTEDLTPHPVRPNWLSFSDSPAVPDMYVAARRNIALTATTGVSETPLPPRAASEAQASGRAEMTVIASPVEGAPRISNVFRDNSERAETLAHALAATIKREIERLKSERRNDPERQSEIDFLEIISATLYQIATTIREARQAVAPQDREQKFVEAETLASSLAKAGRDFAQRNYERVVDYGGYCVMTILGTQLFATMFGLPYDEALAAQLMLLGFTGTKK